MRERLLSVAVLFLSVILVPSCSEPTSPASSETQGPRLLDVEASPRCQLGCLDEDPNPSA